MRKKIILNDQEMHLFFERLSSAETDAEKYPYIHYLLSETNNTFVFDCNAAVEPGKFFRSLKRLFDDEEAQSQVCIVNNLQHIFRRYIRIDGLERLLAMHYTDIEWSMYMEYDFEEEQPKYYREHFIHQFRDAFFAFSLLSKEEVHEAMLKWYRDQDSTLSNYIKNILDHYMKRTDTKEEKREGLFCSVLYKSVLLSAVFHDLGYPLSHFSRASRQIEDSLPYHGNIFKVHKASFQEIHVKLGNFLLFRSVKLAEIKKKYEKNDHGVLSAICFLLNFYDTGGINELLDIERCIIELSARSIYDHTNKYEDNERMTFHENPVSYLLRICDDLQEWSRFYISLDHNSNAMLDPDTCKTVFTNDNQSYQTATNLAPLFLKTTNIRYKKMNFIDACRHITMENKDEKFIIHIDYNKYALLEIASMNFSYALHRNNELKKLANMFHDQLYIPVTEIEYVLSNNVFFLANEMIKEFDELLKTTKFTGFVKSNQMFKDLFSKRFDRLLQSFQELREEIKNQFNKNKLYEKPLLYYNLSPKSDHSDPDRVVQITTRQYSDYIIQSERFLKECIGLLGLANVLMQEYEKSP